MNNLDLIAANHLFWYTQAAQALRDMHRSAFDLNSNQFDLAQERFILARKRAREEFQRFLVETQPTLEQPTEETGQP